MEITNISQLDRNLYKSQDYKPQDEALLNELIINKEFGIPEDKIEIHIISPENNILNSIYDFRNYTVESTENNSSLYNQIGLNPKSDLESFGLFTGQYNVNYNFLRNLFLSSFNQRFFIKEISSDRTELRISSNGVSYEDLGQSYLDFIATRNSRNFYSDFLLNFGDNKLLIAVNIAFDNVNTTLPSLYIKLYEPLPSDITLNTTLWIVEQISEPYSFQVNTEFIAEEISDSILLRGPNINVELNEQINLTTPYLNLSNLLDTNSTSSFQQLQSLLEEKSIDINIDYDEFSNFIHFSSAKERLENFKFKLNQIQSLQNDLNNLNNLSPLSNPTYINSNKNVIQNKIDNIIEKLDGYEYYLYYESGSNAWPKTNSTKPYINSPVNSSESLTWFGSIDPTSQYYGGKILDADNYDVNSKDYIWNNLPEYIKSDSQNQNLQVFVSMLGQHYDYIWTYIKDISNIPIADNRLNYGISKDLIAETLKNFGIKLYTNSRNSEDIYTFLLGITPEGTTLPSTGSYLIENYVTASQETIPGNDIVKETYKRIYHNLPYLLKTKGTKTGLRALINCFGIPETILRVNEFGGLRKENNIDNLYEKFNYALSNSDLQIPFYPSFKQYLDTTYDDIYPDTLEFRFKLDPNNILPTQSILESDNDYKIIKVNHTEGINANINFGLSNGTDYIYSPSIELPLYNNEWWTLNLTRETGSIQSTDSGDNQIYTLYIGDKGYRDINNFKSCSLTIDGSTQSQYNLIGWNTEDILLPGSQQNIQYPFTGSIQEFRYWIDSIPINNFKDHILNPLSISYLDVTSSYDNLIFRLPLGSELDNNITPIISSVHPSSTSSFYLNNVDSSEADIAGDITYNTNIETYLINSPNVGTITEINNKINIPEQNLIPGDVLTPYISIQKPGDIRPTNDLNIVEVSLSPQDSINEDIIAQLGNFNIDEYIGDPRLAHFNQYPELNNLKNFYFQKYFNKQNIFDLIKLLSYFDNSLFKMIKDFVPAKTNLSTGLVIKSHLLERNKSARHEPTLDFVQYEGSIETAFIEGSSGLNQILNTDHTITIPYISGSIFKVNNDKKENFNGELGGTTLTVHSQSLENIIYELNNLPYSASLGIINRFSRLPIIPLYNNVNKAIPNKSKLKLDYSTNPNIPSNINFIRNVYNGFDVNNLPFLFSEVQQSNYTLKRHTQPRYEGSKIIGAKYNTFTPGDISLGNEPVINNNTTKFVYFNEIYQPLSPVSGNIGGIPTISFPGRINADIKYLIDSSSNVIELTQANKNLFDIQSIYNNTLANVSLFDINKPSNQKLLDGFKPIYAGGFRYEPILQNYQTNINQTWTSLEFELDTPFLVDNPDPNTQVTQSLNSEHILISNPSLTNPTHTAGNQNTLTSTLQSGLRFNVTRNTDYNGEIRQRIQGSVTITIKVGGSNEPVEVFKGLNFQSPSRLAPLVGIQPTSPNGVTTYGYNIEGLDFNDKLRSIKVPAGKKVTMYGRGGLSSPPSGPIRVFTGPIQASGGFCPLCSSADGYDSMLIELNDTSLTIGGSSFNPFGTVVLNQSTSTSIPVTTELIFQITFNYDGLIILPAGENSAIGTNGILLRKLDGSFNSISYNFTFTKGFTSPRIRFIPPTPFPRVFTGIDSINEPYFLTDPPSQISISTLTASANLGANPGEHWFFERGNSVNFTENGSKYTYLTSSFDLSKLYLEYTLQGNNLLQILPTSSINDPIAPLQVNEEYFLPKKGDLIRFYNHISETFPISSDFEREIINIFPPLNGNIGTGSNGTGSYQNRLVFEVVSKPQNDPGIPNDSCINYESLNTSTPLVGQIQNFIFISKIPDETNIVLNTTKKIGISSDGIILAESINDDLKEEAGNIVKDLKSQNLI